MKKMKAFLIFLLAGLQSAIVFAQDKKVDIDINTHEDKGIWGQPWMWVVGGAVFILLLVAILKSGSRKSA